MFDIVAVLLVSVAVSPLIIGIIIWIKINSKGSLFFIQQRVGLNFKIFNIYKFRSMVSNANNLGPSITSSDDNRITKSGKILRKTKLDEIPQFLNVLKGDMSIVGPRPEVLKFVNQKKEDYKKILKIKPGITDNAAIKFRDEEVIMEQYKNKEKAYIDFILPKKIQLYLDYIKNISFLNDLRIILNTLKII
ncbi:MAG: sugar transferase [Gammaproteobacteria bacterium]|nr:MAG: sugar transferase [Gammaproteobacteria bacterium]